MDKEPTDMCRVSIKMPRPFAGRARFLAESIRDSFYGIISAHSFDERVIKEWFLEPFVGYPLTRVNLYLPRYSVEPMRALARSLLAVNHGDPVRVEDKLISKIFNDLFPGGI